MIQFKNTKGLIQLLEDATSNAQTIEKVSKPIFGKVIEELFGDNGISWNSLSIALDLLQSIQFVIRHHKGCFVTLDSAGLSEFLSAMMKRIITSLTNNGEKDLPIFVESCTETIVAVADSEQAAKSKMVSEQIGQLLDLVQHQSLIFKTKLEVLRSVNMLLEQCPVNVKECILENSDTQQKIKSLVEMVASIGDYEFQVCIIECLMRIFPRKSRQLYAEMFIQQTIMKDEFLMIRDKVFETDCRLFLNNVNARNDDPTKGVYSFPCVTACIGTKQLRKPDDPNYEEFWVDFNLGSSRITIFCEQEGRLSQESQMDETLWETIEISRTNIKKYAIGVENDKVSLEFHLKNSLNQLYPSQQNSEQSGCCITLEFVIELEDHVAHAVKETFNLEKKKAKASTVEFPLEISVKDQECHEDRRQDVSQAVNSQDQNSQSDVTKKRKVSVPNAPLKLSPDDSPSSKSEQKTDVPEVEKVPNDKAPKTPSKKSKPVPKVKTPVVEISSPLKKTDADKSNKSRKKKESKRKTKKFVSKQDEDTVIPETQQCVEENKEESKSETSNTSKSDNQKEDNSESARKKSSMPSIPMKQVLNIEPKETVENIDEVRQKGNTNDETGISKEEEVIEESQLSQHDQNRKEHKSDPELPTEIVPDDVNSICENMNKQISDNQDFQEGNKTLDHAEKGSENDFGQTEDKEEETVEQNNTRTDILKRLPKQKSSGVNTFGFDDLGDIDTIPESLEPVTDCALSVIERHSKVCGQENDNKHKHVKEQVKTKSKQGKEKFKTNDKQGKEQLKNDGKQETEQMKIIDKKEKGKCKNNKQGKEPQKSESKNNDKADQVDKQKSHTSKNNKQTEKAKSFTDVDKSLKELCDLDEKENFEKDSTRKKGNQMLDEGKHLSQEDERKPLSQEEIDDLYTFKEPDRDTCYGKPKENISKPLQKAKSPASYCVKKYASKILNVKGNNKKADKLRKTSKIKGNMNDVTEEKRCKAASQVCYDKSSDNDTCNIGDRTLRHRKTKPNYAEPSDISADSIYQDEIEHDASDDNTNLQDDQLSKKIDENGLFSSPNKKLICNESLSSVKTESNKNKENLDVGKIVTVNSDDSDIDNSQNIADQNNNSDSGNGECLIAEKYEESINESLYVESDDSCNARSYKLNCKERKRRSSLKHKEEKKRISAELIENNSKTICGVGHTDASKSLRKSVSFDDSVLKDLSPIQKDTDNTKIQNTNSSKDALSHNSNRKSTSRGKKKHEQEKKYEQHKQEKIDISPEISQDKQENKDKRKKTVQASYSKFESKTRPWSKLQALSKTKPGSGYDPFDFEAQADNASNRSERLDRQDMSKSLNEKHSGRKKDSHKSHRQKKSKSVKKCADDSLEHSSPMCDAVENDPPVLMVQDQHTKKWHRSSDLAKRNTVRDRTVKKENLDSKAQQDNYEDKSSASSLSPLQIESDKPFQCAVKNTVSDDSDAGQNNTFKNILRDIESSRQKSNKQKTDKYIKPEDTCMQDYDHISPIQTPYLSCASTPKISSGKRKQYTPLNISVIKTPQSAVSEKDDNVSWQNIPDDSLMMSTDRNNDTSHPSEKSWILSKKKKKKNKENQGTYKPKRRERPQKYYKSEESDSDYEESEGAEEVIGSEVDKAKKYSEMLRSLIKPCMIKLDDIVLASGGNDKYEESVTTETSQDIQTPACKTKKSNLEDVILTPYTPVKQGCINKNEDSFIDMEQTHENLSLDLSDQDDDSSQFYSTKQQKLILLGDSGFHSGPSSAVKRLSSSSLKRKYPDLNLLEDGEDTDVMTSQSSDEEADNVPVVPKKLFKFDFSANQQKAPISDAISCSDVTEDLSNFNFNSGLPGFLNSFGSDVQRQMERKKEQVEAFTKQAVKELQKHHSQNWVVQQQYRSNVDVEYKTKMMLELEALERDIDLLREAGQKTTDLYQFQLDVLHRNHSRQTTSLNNMRGLQSYLKDKSRKVGHHNRNLQNDLKDVLRKDVNQLQKRLIEQTQKEEFQNVKRNLQRTFSSSMMW